MGCSHATSGVLVGLLAVAQVGTFALLGAGIGAASWLLDAVTALLRHPATPIAS